MIWIKFGFGILAVGVLILGEPLEGSRAWPAEDPAARSRIEELERSQRELLDEVRRLRERLDKFERDEKATPKESEVAAPSTVPPAAQAVTGAEGRVAEVERRQGILTDELRRLRDSLFVPETTDLKSYYGLGPAASKVYGVKRGLSIGGYGETNFKFAAADKGDSKNEFDFVRFVLYTGYKFNDWIVLNSEIEFEHATTDHEGEVSVEFAAIDFLFDPRVNARAGLVLVPMGFLNEIHEPPFFFGNQRPPVERAILPSTWSSNGFGIYGELLPDLEYRTYGLTGFNAKRFSSDGIREGRQSGSEELANDWAWVGRLDYTFAPGFLFGGSAYLGNSGQSQTFGDPEQPDMTREAGVFTQIYEGHLQARYRGLEFRALGSLIYLDDVGVLSRDPDIGSTVANSQFGYYVELGYDVLPLLVPGTTQYLAPWFRYSKLDTQDNVPRGFDPDLTKRREFYQFGLQYKPIPQVVFKLDYSIQDAKEGELPDELRTGFGFVF